MRYHVATLCVIIALVVWYFTLTGVVTIVEPRVRHEVGVQLRGNPQGSEPLRRLVVLSEVANILVMAVCPLVAAMAVVGLSRWRLHLRRAEGVFVVSVFVGLLFAWSAVLGNFDLL